MKEPWTFSTSGLCLNSICTPVFALQLPLPSGQARPLLSQLTVQEADTRPAKT